MNHLWKNLAAKPVLKWAGGKGQLLPQIQTHLPAQIIRYAEPFLGSGAVFFFIAQTYQPRELYISDRNPDLILLYQVIQTCVEELIEILEELQAKFYSLSKVQQAEFFYQVRHEFNNGKPVLELDYEYEPEYREFPIPKSAFSKTVTCEIESKDFSIGKPSLQKVGTPRSADRVRRAAQIIFLNRTCFNGLFRVNAQGKFNVPFGDYKRPKICDRTNLIAVSHILKHTQIAQADFTECAKFCDKETFVYFDPPYRPLSKTANFNAYSTHSFSDEEQIRLAHFCHYLDQQGVKWLLSNSDPHNTDPNDHFFDKLYQPFHIHRITASRMINCIPSKRAPISEILVKNYQT